MYGRPITFGHLTLIVKEEEAGRRRVLIGDVFRQGLTVQELAARIDKRSRRKGQVSRRSVKANVDKVKQRASRYLDTQGGSNEEIVELLAEQIVHGEVPSDTLVELAGDLAVIRLQYKTVVQSAQWTVDRLGQLNRELTQADGGPSESCSADELDLEDDGAVDTPPHASDDCKAFRSQSSPMLQRSKGCKHEK